MSKYVQLCMSLCYGISREGWRCQSQAAGAWARPSHDSTNIQQALNLLLLVVVVLPS